MSLSAPRTDSASAPASTVGDNARDAGRSLSRIPRPPRERRCRFHRELAPRLECSSCYDDLHHHCLQCGSAFASYYIGVLHRTTAMRFCTAEHADAYLLAEVRP